MSYRFTLQLIRVECVHEAALEPGKDEMHLLGFGVSRKGHVFATGYRGLGSYSSGNANTGSGFPLTLFQGELEDDGLDALAYLWLVEEDGGGVSAKATQLETEFRASYLAKAASLNDVQFPRDCIPFTAFYKAMPSLEDSLQRASTDGLNDEVFAPVDFYLKYASGDAAGLNTSRDVSFTRSKDLGLYNVYLRYSYHKIPIAFG